jgi:hypothetical protein
MEGLSEEEELFSKIASIAVLKIPLTVDQQKQVHDYLTVDENLRYDRILRLAKCNLLGKWGEEFMRGYKEGYSLGLNYVKSYDYIYRINTRY